MSALPDLSVQLYSVREPLGGDLFGTLARLSEIGFSQVEPFDLLTDAERLRVGLDSNGLAAPTAHASLVGRPDDVERTLDAALTVGVRTVIDPWVDPERWTTADGVHGVADALSSVAQRAAERGLQVGYHNHWFEFESQIDGRSAYELFAAATDPAVLLELDTYWAAVGGADVPALITALGDRVRFLHLKDGPINRDTSAQLPLGEGAMPVPAIVAAATALQVPVIEFDAFAGDIFDGVRRSFAYASTLAR